MVAIKGAVSLREVVVSKAKPDTLTFLKEELAFLERGSYGGSLPWRPVSIFMDSPSCPNRLDKDKSTPCQHCWLYQFVPDQFQHEPGPCHFIALNRDAESIHSMSRQYRPDEVEQAVRGWLKTEIRRLESPAQKEGAALSGTN
jgi:hypothetical protein